MKKDPYILLFTNSNEEHQIYTFSSIKALEHAVNEYIDSTLGKEEKRDWKNYCEENEVPLPLQVENFGEWTNFTDSDEFTCYDFPPIDRGIE